MNEKFNEKEYLSFIYEVKNKLDSLKSSISIEVISNNHIIAEDIKKYLTNHNIKITKSPIKMVINVKAKRSSLDLIAYEIYINVKYKNTIIGSNYFRILLPKSSSLSGYLYSEIKSLPLEKFLGLK